MIGLAGKQLVALCPAMLKQTVWTFRGLRTLVAG